MKTLARIAAILSFACCFLPGAWLLLNANAKVEPIAIIVGLFLVGNAFFAGPMLWLAGEKYCSNQAKADQ